MKPKTKKALWFTGIAFGALTLFGAKKLNAAKEVMNQLQLRVLDIGNIKLSWQKVTFDVKPALYNPTNVQFGFTSTSHIFIKKLNVYSPTGKLIASGNTKLYDIKIPAKSEATLPNIKITATLSEAVKQLFSQNLDTLNYSLDVEAFGNTFTLEP